MKISVPKETHPGENRAPLTPDAAGKLVKLGAQVEVEAGLGVAAGFPDEAYTKAGATIATDRKALIGSGDIVLRLRKPPVEEIAWLKPNAIHASLLDPFNEKELVNKFAERGVSAISMEFIPRTTRAQKMDVLSSQANLGGYEAVILGRALFQQDFPHDDHGGGNDSAVQGFHHRRRRGRFAGDCHGETARRESHRLRHAARRRGTGEIARRAIPEN